MFLDITPNVYVVPAVIMELGTKNEVVRASTSMIEGTDPVPLSQ